MPVPISLQPLLRQPYSRDTYRTILEDILPSGTLDLRQVPQPIVATCDFVRGTLQTGTIELPDGNSIALLEVEVSDQVKLARNRVSLRNFVARFIDEASTTAVLAVFHQPGKFDWRLTYACKRSQIDDDTLEITSTQTAPRRYTFLLGRNEPCRTAAGRLAELREKGDQLGLDDVEKAFSVERLNKEFFKEYKKHYETFVAHLLSPAHAKTTRAAFGVTRHFDPDEQSKADKPIRDFVKRLLGRFVFLHFLQKKGWMGCKAGSKAWTGGDPDFLSSYFALAEAKGEGDCFHSRWLIPLFFDALNNAERTGELFAPTGTRIPYLNGGLFETDPAPLQALDFPADHFRALLDFFGQYHFTIDENDPEDHEVGIDPEMLGHIFENLLEDNKDKGAYYTPKAIVAYMARQSLLHYLQTHLGEHEELGVLLNEKDFTRLEKDGFVHRNARRIEELLDEVKICDPAIGSGAFPIGLLHEILWTRLTLDLTLNTAEERAKLKRRIIQNSIHGVDLDPGAVEIARLRFWLALVVDEDQPRPLPNLDYKIHRADSLIEYIRGEPVHLGKVSTEDKRTHGAIQKLIEAKAQLFSAQKVTEKRAARFALYRALAEVAMAEFTWLRNEMGLFAKDAERAAQLDLGLKEFGHRIKLIDSVTRESARSQDRALEELRAWFDDEKKPTFLWQMHFGEIFERSGFDIVIANPPYVSAIDHKKSAGEGYRSAIKQRFSVASGAWDLYIPFFQLGADILRPSGCLCLICPNKYLSASYAGGLRRFIYSQLHLRTLANVSRVEVFESVSVYPVITLLLNQPLVEEDPIVILAPPSDRPSSRSVWTYSSTAIASSVLTLLPEFIWGFLLSPTIELLTRVLGRCRSLETFAEVNATTTAAEADTYGSLLTEESADSWYVINTGTIDPYRSLWGSRSLVHQGQTLATPMLPKTAKKISAGRKKLYSSPKLIFAKMALRFEGFVDRSGSYAALNVNCVHTPREGWSLQSLAAILHSRCIHHIYSQYFDALRMAGGYLPFQSPQARVIPIPPASPADKTRLADLAQACAEVAQRGDDESLAVHEAEIDEIVYRLFELTPEEISLIEAALTPTRSTTSPRRRKASSTASAASAPLAETTAGLPPAAEPAASPSPWIPGELFAQEGELPAQPRRPSARAPRRTAAPAVVPSGHWETTGLLAQLRAALAATGPTDRETLIREAAHGLGYQRTGRTVAAALGNAIRTAVRRGLIRNDRGTLSLRPGSPADWCAEDREGMKSQLLAALSEDGRVWINRDDVPRRLARWFGYQRTSKALEATAHSLVRSLLRENKIEKCAGHRIRRN